MFDVETFKRTYPEWFEGTSALDILAGVFVFSLLFLIPYIYVRFIEDRLVSLFNNRLVPFFKIRLHMEKLVELVNRILKIQIFRVPRIRT